MANRPGRIALFVTVGAMLVVLFGCGGGDGSGVDDTMVVPDVDDMAMMPDVDDAAMMPDVDDTTMPDVGEFLPTDPQAVAAMASSIRDVTSLEVREEYGQRITGWLWPTPIFPDSGSQAITLSQYHKYGQYVLFAVVTSVGEELGLYARAYPEQGSLSDEIFVLPWTDFVSEHRDQEKEGFTTSYDAVDHGLGSGWRGFQGVDQFDDGGVLQVRYFTDLEDSQDFIGPFNLEVGEWEHVIRLTDDRIPALPAGRGGVYVIIPEDGLRGSLNGVEGTFSCSAASCGLFENVADPIGQGGWAIWVTENPVQFTPVDESQPQVTVDPLPIITANVDVPKFNYLYLGNWLYAPGDITDTDAFEFTAFSGGDDPFVVDNIQGLTGGATYEGVATGMYAEAQPEASVAPFEAKVELEANFGAANELGTVAGKVYEFNIEGGKISPLMELSLGLPSRGEGIRNIFESRFDDGSPLPGAWVEGLTEAAGGWHGRWGGQFFGNGGAGTDLPTSFAGTFGATDDDRSIAGSFGVHRP